MKFLRDIANDMYLRRPPTWMVITAIILVIASWLPMVYIARMRTNPDTKPPIQLFQGMFHQPKYEAQEVNPIFADRRAMRQPVAGTVARGALIDPHFSLGFRVDDDFEPVTTTDDDGNEQTQYYDTYPEQVQIDSASLRRGQQQYMINCYPCHGMAGYGDGPINQRATDLAGSGAAPPGRFVWTPASNLHATGSDGELIYGPEQYPEGKMYNIITNGIRNMPAYGSQIEPIDRWAIVAYVRALQVSQTAPVEQVPDDRRDPLRSAAWADYAQRQVASAEVTLRQMTTRLQSVERDAQEAPGDAEVQANYTRLAGLLEQARAAMTRATESAQAARAAAERDDLAGAMEAGEQAAAATEQLRDLQEQMTEQPEEQPEEQAGEGGETGDQPDADAPDPDQDQDQDQEQDQDPAE